MKILYAITKSNWGGAQRYLYDLASGLPKNRFEVGAVAGGEGILIEKLQAAGIKTRTLPILQETSSLFRSLFSFVNLKAAWDLRKIIKEERPDVLHLNSSKIMGLGSLAALGLKTKVVSTIHGWPFLEPRFFPVRALIFFLSWLSVIFQDKIILITKRDLNIAKKIIPSKKLNYIPNGISSIDFLTRREARAFLSGKIGRQIPDQTLVIDTISELIKNKGLGYLIAAARLIPGSKFLILIIGEGEDRKNLESRIGKQELQDKVRLLGFIPEAGRYLKGFDIFIMPSLKEGLPYAVMEAMEAGIAVVASKVGGIPDLIQDRKNGLLIPPADAKAISDALNFLISHPEERAKLGENGAEDAKTRFTLDKMLKKTTELYETK